MLLVVAGAMFLLRTGAGQRFVLDQILPRISRETGVTIEIADVGGAWPARLRLTGVRLSDAKGLWFEAKRITVHWQPLLAWSGIYLIDSARIDGGHVLREPDLPDDGARHPLAPGELSPVRIDNLDIIGFKIEQPLFDQAMAFDLKGDVAMERDGAIDANIDARVSSADLVEGTLAKLVGPTLHLTTRLTSDTWKS